LIFIYELIFNFTR